MTGTPGFNTPKCRVFEDRRTEASRRKAQSNLALAGSLRWANMVPALRRDAAEGPPCTQRVSGAWERLVLFISKINGHSVDLKEITQISKTSKPTESVNTNKLRFQESIPL